MQHYLCSNVYYLRNILTQLTWRSFHLSQSQDFLGDWETENKGG